MSLTPRLVALQGFGGGAAQTALQGLLAVSALQPSTGGGGFVARKKRRPTLRDLDVLDEGRSLLAAAAATLQNAAVAEPLRSEFLSALTAVLRSGDADVGDDEASLPFDAAVLAAALAVVRENSSSSHTGIAIQAVVGRANAVAMQRRLDFALQASNRKRILAALLLLQ